jgi:hypothetical protein
MTRIQSLILLLFAAVVIPSLVFATTTGPSPVPNPPAFQVSTNAITLCKGVVNNVPLLVQNLGKSNGSITMESVQLGLASSKIIVEVANGSTSLLTLPPNTVVDLNMPIFVSLNASSLISAGVTVNFNYLNYYSDSEVRNVSFGAESCPSQLNVSLSQKVITSGKISNVTFNLNNTGATQLNDVSFSAKLPTQDGEVLSTQPILVGSIPAFGSTTVRESLFVNSNASETFPVNLSISLYNGTSFEQLAPSIAALSSGIINMSATGITLSPSAPTPGSIFSISFILTDLGTVGASAVTATVTPPAGLTVFGSNSVFIGNMQVDSQTPVTLTLSASSSAGNYTVPIMITYLNNLRQQETARISVPVDIASGALSSNGISSTGGRTYTSANGTTVYQKRSAGGGILILILLIAVIVLAVLLFRERKKHTKK